MTSKTIETKATEQTKARYGSKENPLTALDALSRASGELERLSCVLDDSARSVRLAIAYADASDAHETAAFLRNLERVLFSGYDECCKVEEAITPTLERLRADKVGAGK